MQEKPQSMLPNIRHEAYESLFDMYSEIKRKHFPDEKFLQLISATFEEALDENILHEEAKSEKRLWNLQKPPTQFLGMS